MTILGVDSATSTASAALIENGKIIADRVYPSKRQDTTSPVQPAKLGHAEILVPLIAGVLQQAQRSLSDLSAIAVSIGPGSFTGLRIGLSTVKGLAYGSTIPVAGLSTLLANAARVTDVEGMICSLLDARRQQVYTAFFRRSGASLIRLTEDAVMPLDAAAAVARQMAAGAPCLFICDDAKKFRDVLRRMFGPALRYSDGEGYPSLAAALARLAQARPSFPADDSAAQLVPVYLRPADAEFKRQESI